MPKFFKSTRSDLFTRCLVGSLWLFWLVPEQLLAQDQATPSPSPKPALAYVRFWNMLSGKTVPTLELLMSEDKPLTTAFAHNYMAGYNAVAPGTYNFVVRKVGDTTNPLKKQSVLLRADTYITFLVSDKSGQPSVELLDDTIDPKKPPVLSRLTIRQYMPGVQVTVSTKEGKTSPTMSYGDVGTIEDLPNNVTFLIMRATGLGPDVKIWNTEADFSFARHATLLVVADPYGRFRPRLSYDGQLGSAKPDPVPSPKP